MFTLTFTNWLNETITQQYDDSSDAINAAVELQVAEGGYNTSGEWFYTVTDAYSRVVYEDECMRLF